MSRPLDPDARAPAARDADTVTGFLAGDAGAHEQVREWVARVVRNGNWRFRDAEAVVQDVLVRLLRDGRKGRFRGGSRFKTYVYSVAKHACIDVWRHERFRSRHEAPAAPGHEDGPSPLERAADPDDPERAHARRERHALVEYLFQRLSDDCRQLWRWVYWEGRAAREVAERLGISSGNARVRVHRCLQKARTLAGEAMGEIA